MKMNNLKKENNKHYSFYINNKKYWYKFCSLNEVILELFIMELADLYGISHINYELGLYDGNYGLISEDINNYVKLDSKYDLYGTDNNIEYIGNLLLRDNIDIKTINNMTDQLYNIYIFDMLIGNSDRNSSNILINNSNIGKILDNSLAFNSDYMFDNNYSLYLDNLSEEDSDGLLDFLDRANIEYINLLKDKIELFNENNINMCINKFRDKYKDFDDDYICSKLFNMINNNIIFLKNKINKYEKRKSY